MGARAHLQPELPWGRPVATPMAEPKAAPPAKAARRGKAPAVTTAPREPLFRWDGPKLVVRLELQTKNEANLASPHTPFLVASYRKKVHRVVAEHMLACPKFPLPCVVTLKRFSAGKLDKHDGLPNSQKTVVDELAKWLGLPVNKRGHADDSDPRVEWKYDQAKCPAKQGWVEVTFEPIKAGGAQ